MSASQRWWFLLAAVVAALFGFTGQLSASGPSQPTPSSTPVPRHPSPLDVGRVHLFPTRQVAKQLAPTLAAPDTSPLLYNGGPIMPQTVNYAIFWLPSGSHFEASGSAADDTRYEGLVQRYFQDIGHSDFYNLLAQYPDTTTTPLNAASWGGSYVDQTPYTGGGSTGQALVDQDIQAAVTRALSANGWTPDITHSFVVFTAYGIVSCADASHTQCSNNYYCGYHGDYLLNGSEVIYTNMPDLGTMLSNGCAVPQSPNGDPTADAELNVLSHEHFESASDPEPSDNLAWVDASGNENGDKCAWQFGSIDGSQANIHLNGNPYMLQTEWSNASGGCSQFYPTLSFTTAPAGAQPGQPFATQPVVKAVDVHGNVVSSFSGVSIHLAIKSGTGTPGARIGGFPVAQAAGGVATFSGISIDSAGTGYVLTAVGAGAASGASPAFDVTTTTTTAGTLAFTTQPGAGNFGKPLPVQPVVTLLDGNNQPVSSFNGLVTLTVKAGAGATGATLTNATATAASGVATFSGLSISLAHTGYILTASATGVTAGDSSAFTVLPIPDANGDGVVTPLDAQCILRSVAGIIGGGCPNPLPNGAVAGGSVATPLDAQCVLRWIAALGPTAGCPFTP
ncbi:MAG: hypothetical protein ACYDCQ_04100 [Dehalococcoidia bacterium]